MGEHKTHIAEQTNIGFINEYYMKDNPITQSLISFSLQKDWKSVLFMN